MTCKSQSETKVMTDHDAPALPAEFAAQGSPEWHAARLGKITGSEFAKIVTEATGAAKKPRRKGELMAATAESYVYQCVGEILTGEPADVVVTKAMQWGTDNEPTARKNYELRTPCKVQQVGFVLHPEEPLVGCSPDGFVGDDGLIEIKCPFTTAKHVEYTVRGAPACYLPQVQGALWITHRKWCDFITFDPRVPTALFEAAHVVHRVLRDEVYIELLEEAVFAAVKYRNDILAHCLDVDVEQIPETLERLGLAV